MRTITAALLLASAAGLLMLVTNAGAATVTPLTYGLDSPRGLAFSPLGTLNVAEAGHGGDVCIPDGPCIGDSGQISTVDTTNGAHSPWVTGLFSLMDSEGGAIGIDGLSALGGGHLFGIMGINPQSFAGADCTQIPKAPADCAQVLAAAQTQAGALLRFAPDGSWNNVADVGGFDYQFTLDNPGGSTFGTEIDANPYGVLASSRGTYVADAGANTLDWVSTDGTVSVAYRFPVPEPGRAVPDRRCADLCRGGERASDRR